MNHDSPTSFSRGRRWSIGANVFLSALAVLALLAMVNYLAARHFRRFPVSELAKTELGTQTVRILQAVTNNVHVTIYFDREDSLYPMVNALLKEYKFSNARIGVETVDYLRDPAAAQIIKNKYKLAVDDQKQKNLVIFDCNGRTKVVYEKELSDLDLEPLMSGRSREVRRSNFKGELLFTSAVFSVTSPRSLKAYFLQGNGQLNPESTDTESGFSSFAGLLRENNVEWEKLSLLGTNDVPSDCSLLIVADARTALAPEELNKIDAYLKNGGRALFLFSVYTADPVRKTGLEKVLSDWGVEVGHNVVRDPKNSISGQDLVASRFTTHAIMAPLLGTRLHLILPRSISKSGRGPGRADAPNVTELVLSESTAQLLSHFNKGTPMPEPNDVQTNASLAVAVEKGKLQGLTAERGTTRLVVVGDSLMFANQMLESAANRDFAGLTLNWLLDRSQLLGSLAPRPIKEWKLVMTQSQMLAVRCILLLGMPGAVLLLGGLVWVQRRH